VSRPTKIQNEMILEAARKVFLSHGYQASTAKIARAAGVSEGSLFKHFATKSALFSAAMQAETQVAAYEDRLMESAGTGDIRDNLTTAALKLLSHLQTVLPRLIMMKSSGMVVHGPAWDSDNPPPLQHMRIVAAYLRKEIRLGRLIVDAPEMRAHVLIGGLSHYVTCDLLFHYRPGSPDAYVRTLIEAILPDSAIPATAIPPRRKKPTKV
jgi:AcrR family transcriptional regulator